MPARYPTGIQSFPEIINGNKVYVDKTELLYRLASAGRYYFLSRPRRFGKSLMLSTLRAYFEGRRELFEGLAVANLETEWRKHPVIYLSMGKENITDVQKLEYYLSSEIEDNALRLGVDITKLTPATKFAELIYKANQIYGEKVVVLIDEYDKYLLDTRHREEDLHDGVRSELRGFYGCIKESADYLRFAMITGVTKFSHVNIFSGLNNLMDISLDPEYNALCGISESEMKTYFTPDMEVFAERNGLTPEEAAGQFRLHYDGYRFASRGENIYNPFSTLLAFSKMEFGNYWFASGTSRHLVEDLKRKNYRFDNIDGIKATADQLMREPIVSSNPTALLYQAGYLTIKDYKSGFYYLGFPNKEVQSGFYDELLQLLVPVSDTEFSAQLLALYAEEGDAESIMNMLQTGLSKFNNMEMQKVELEYHLKVILKSLLMAAGLRVEGEILAPAGRIDMALKTREYIYLFEFKINSTAKKALAQIDDKDYPFHYHGDPRQIIKIGASYSTRYRRLTSCIVISE